MPPWIGGGASTEIRTSIKITIYIACRAGPAAFLTSFV
jgi:hypothetical protein